MFITQVNSPFWIHLHLLLVSPLITDTPGLAAENDCMDLAKC